MASRSLSSFVLTKLLLTLLTLVCVSTVHALDVRQDFDLDNDGLIEIFDLNDLDEIRRNLNGSSLYGQSHGCPEMGCVGFELVANLDFDVNADGVLDSRDSFWNDGQGWDGIGEFSTPLKAIFEGNGFFILNLYINRPNINKPQGLFARVDNSEIRGLNLSGDIGLVNGGRLTGAIVGYAYFSEIIQTTSTLNVEARGAVGGLLGVAFDSVILESWSTGDIIGREAEVGGLVGYATSSRVEGSFSAGNVRSLEPGAAGLVGITSNVGGLIGGLSSSKVIACFSSGDIFANDSNVGGLVGYSDKSEIVASLSFNNFLSLSNLNLGPIVGDWDSDGLEKSYWLEREVLPSDVSSEHKSEFSDLICPQSEIDQNCAQPNIFEGWQVHRNLIGSSYWEFGDVQDLPGLMIGDSIYRYDFHESTVKTIPKKSSLFVFGGGVDIYTFLVFILTSLLLRNIRLVVCLKRFSGK